MKDTAYECKTSDELREDILALRLRLAFQEELEEEVNALVKESENPDRVILEIMERADSRVIQKIRQKIRRKNGKHLLFAVVPKVGKAAAACLLVFFIGLSTAIAMNSSVRVEMLNFIMRIEENTPRWALRIMGHLSRCLRVGRGIIIPPIYRKGLTM